MARTVTGIDVPPTPPEGLPSWLHWFWELGAWIVRNVVSTFSENLTWDFLRESLAFLVVVVLFYLVGRMTSKVVRRTFRRGRAVDPGLNRLIGHLIVFSFVILGFSLGLTIFGTSIAQFATALGLLSLALGFGMQNTVANIMGGMSLAVDKPFRIGDRIKVGDYWGTVQLIGLRSTRLETPRKETVIIPNKVMEEREIWNYTIGSPNYRLDIDVPISFDSDWRLAERIMLEVVDAHPNILHYPPARVLLREFADTGVQLQLRAWIADVTVRADTISDILKAIKDRFDQRGVEIPYPYRTILQKAELRKPSPPAAEIRPFSRQIEGMQQKLLVAVAGPQPVYERASFVASLAKAVSAGVVALYIEGPGAQRRLGEDALRHLGEIVRSHRIWYKPVVRSGDVVGMIRDVAREEDVDLILVGAGRGVVSQMWRRTPEIGSRLRRELSRPVFTVPKDLKLTPQLVNWLKEQMRAARELREGGAGATAAPSSSSLPPPPEAPPGTSPPPPTSSNAPGREGSPAHDEPSESQDLP